MTFAIDKASDFWSQLASWRPQVDSSRGTFARQALPMVWDYTEVNPLGGTCGSWQSACIDRISEVIKNLKQPQGGAITNADATKLYFKKPMLFSTDPPYYDNIGYADLSDFFYVWLKKNLSTLYPSLFRTIMTPKVDELVATPYRFDGDKEKAKTHFEDGFSEAILAIKRSSDPEFPITIYYAFKQAESDDDEDEGENKTASTGWETMLEGLINNNLTIIGTWPMHSEKKGRMLSIDTNALASSILP